MDPQGSFREWYEAREDEALSMPGRDPGPDELAASIDAAKAHGFDYIIIDTPPASDAWLSDAMKLADIVLIPVRPTPTDLRAVRATLIAAKEASVEFVFFLSQTTRTKITDEAARVLAQHGRLAPINIALRVVHAETDATGQTAIEATDDKARGEMVAAWNYVKDQMK